MKELHINKKRIRLLQDGKSTHGPVVYWMSRDQRAFDNWALLFAQQLALKNNNPLFVVFNLVDNFLEAGKRQFLFMLKGLRETAGQLADHNITFVLLHGKPEVEIPAFIKEHNCAALVTDFDPLRIKRIWKRDTAKKINIPFYEVDAHNIVPCLFVSNKEEYAAFTIRPKIHKNLMEFLDDFPHLQRMKASSSVTNNKINWEDLVNNLKKVNPASEINWINPGWSSAVNNLKNFIENKLENYNEDRNDPNKDAQSNFSPYLHFGQISAQRIAIETKKINGNKEPEESFLEELLVRRELSDNFCYYNKNYDSFEGFPNWAKKTLNEHREDKREYIYSLKKLEEAKTHEDLWNAAQMEMVNKGKMHGYMRMYWAKKILEWTNSPEEALKIAIYLNDKYELDGRDPNGYAGCVWSIGGIHDRAWTEREIFGKIRFMNLNGAKRKFDVDKYIKSNLNID